MSQSLQAGQRRAYPWWWIGAHLGDGWLWFSLAALTLWRGSPRLRREAGSWLAASLLASTITTIIKFSAGRKRPQSHTGFYSRLIDRHSFPSGHATRMGTLLIWAVSQWPQGTPLFVLFALWVGVSRIVLGIHFLSDVLAGLVVGSTVATWWRWRMHNRRRRLRV